MSGKLASLLAQAHTMQEACGTTTAPGNLSIAMVLRITLAKLGIRPIVNLRNDM
jgi:hypothetical protein